ncbi:MAG TPA: hypothetical protein VF677_02735 [Flavobacterium sp.]|jgi:hypothetical protein
MKLTGLNNIMDIEFTTDQWIDIIIAVSTLITLVFTFFIVRESARMRRMYITPDISIYLGFAEASPTLLFLNVENYGFGAATKVKFKIIDDYKYYQSDDEHLAKNGIFKNGLEYFYPRQKFRYFINSLADNNEEKIKERFLIEVKYQDLTGRKYKKIFDLKIVEYLGGSMITPPETYVGRISYELEKIKKLYEKDIELRSEKK